MIVSRPCKCDNFLPGRAWIAGRDCARCWMFAHRPSVRKAWGGNPDDCDALFAVKRNMSAADIADLLAGPVLLMPEGWRTWPATREAHLLLAERFLAGMPAYPIDRFAGRGAVICGGGVYEASSYVACRMLRQVGWNHPIQLWHGGDAEPVSARIRRLPGVEVIDTEMHPARSTRRTMGGWESKMFAIIHCPFEEVLFLDADSYPICNPEVCFDPEHNPVGLVTWPDVPNGDHAIQWHSYGLESDGKTGLNGGHYIITKRKAWKVLQLAGHYDNHSDYYYCRTPNCAYDVGGYGDQDQVRAAIHKLGAPSHRYRDRMLSSNCDSYLQPGPHGQPLFVHRVSNKFALPGSFAPPRWYPGDLPMEATAWRFFLEWLAEPLDSGRFPDEVPGWFTREECELWFHTCQGRDVLELGRHQGRSTVVAAHSARKVVSIDPESVVPADFWLQRYGVRHKVWLREGLFADLAPTSGGPFSACLIDGAKDHAGIVADIATVVPLLSPGARIGFHDYYDPTHPEVGPTVDAAAERHGWTLVARADFLGVFATAEES